MEKGKGKLDSSSKQSAPKSSKRKGPSSSKGSSSSSVKKKSHFLSKSVLEASAAFQVVYCRIMSASSSSSYLVFGKETSIELARIDEAGIVYSICDHAVFGTIKDIAILPSNDKCCAQKQQMDKDLLVALSDSGKLSILTFCKEKNRFIHSQHVELSSAGNTRKLLGRMLAVDSSGCFIAASTYEDRLVLFSVSLNGNDIIDEKIIYPSEDGGSAGTSRNIQMRFTIWSMCFISQDSGKPSGEQNALLAVVVNRGRHLNDLLLLNCNVKAHTISEISEYVDDGGSLAHDIAEVPNSCGLAILFRAGDVLLMNFTDPRNPFCSWRTDLSSLPNVVDSSKLPDIKGGMNSGPKYGFSWSWEPGKKEDPRMIVCIDSGEFLMIQIRFVSGGPKVNLSEPLYKGLPCKAILWVEGGYLAALVKMGDGMVLKLEDGRLCLANRIQNNAPIWDMAVVNHPDKKCDEIFACCGEAPEGSLRIIRSGIGVETLFKSDPIYEGVTGTWTIKMKFSDSHDSFLVLTFLEETRIMTVGQSFTDVTDSVGFQPHVSTLACGLVCDRVLVQIHQSAVLICLPTHVAHSDGIPDSSPYFTSWGPDNGKIIFGAVGHNFIIVSTSKPFFLHILQVREEANHYEIYELQHLQLQNELSCISIPTQSSSANGGCIPSLFSGMDMKNIFVIGTRKPSVEICSFTTDSVIVVACATLPLSISKGYVPTDVLLVLVDKHYVLAGLKNGVLLRFELPEKPSPSSSLTAVDIASSSVSSASISFGKGNGFPSTLQLIACYQIGNTTVSLSPLSDTLDAGVIALCDRPWLLHSGRHGLLLTSVSFRPSTHVTSVSFDDCPKGLLFVAGNCLHLVEMVHRKSLNVEKFSLEGTPRKVLYHYESKRLLVMRTGLNRGTCSSDICFVDPITGSILSSFRLDPGETGRSMALVRVGSEVKGDLVLLVGTGLSSDPTVMPTGQATSNKGHIYCLCLVQTSNSDSSGSSHGSHPDDNNPDGCSEPGSSSCPTSDSGSSCSLDSDPGNNSSDSLVLIEQVWEFRLASKLKAPEMVLAICPYLDRYFLVSCGNTVAIINFQNGDPKSPTCLAQVNTRYMVTSLTAEFVTIAVGSCRDGIIFYYYDEATKKFELRYCDPSVRIVDDCILMDQDTAVVSDRKGRVSVLCKIDLPDYIPERNLILSSSYFMAEVALTIQKGSYSYDVPVDKTKAHSTVENVKSIIAGTLLGRVLIFIPISRKEYKLLKAVQASLASHDLARPILGNDHDDFRGRENSVGVRKILDGDMLCQFLTLTREEQENIMSRVLPRRRRIPVDELVRLLDRVYCPLD